jgi:hypothetical protein
LQENGHRYQAGLGALVETIKPLVVVETGVSVGVSTAFILQAMDKNGVGELHSIDPAPQTEIIHSRWHWWRGLSVTEMPEVYRDTGPFDIFLHDSDHGVECQTFEYELAWHMLKPDGYLISDDITWGEHMAWQRFLARHGLVGERLGHAGMVRRTHYRGPPHLEHKAVEHVVKNALALAKQAVLEYGDKPVYS